MLGLLSVEDGFIVLTELGVKFKASPMNGKIQILRERLSSVEPFRPSLELANEKRIVSSEEIADSLAKDGLVWHEDKEVNQDLVKDLLLKWTILLDMLSYDGRSGSHWMSPHKA